MSIFSLTRVEPAFLQGNSSLAFAPGGRKFARIIGASWVKPSDVLDWRVCYTVQWDNGEVDYIPVSDCGIENKPYLFAKDIGCP